MDRALTDNAVRRWMSQQKGSAGRGALETGREGPEVESNESRNGSRLFSRPRVLCLAVPVLVFAAVSPLLATSEPAPASTVAPAAPERPAPVIVALGRLEPRGGLLRLSGPSSASAVVAQLLVEEGDAVSEGQVIALLDTFEVRQAEVERLRVELESARRELARHEQLHGLEVISDSQVEEWQLKVAVAEAELRRARAERDLSRVSSPIDGQVLTVWAHQGERVGAEGIVELGRTNEMFAVAEVYETDIRKVRIGQRARVTSTALAEDLFGTVERMDLKVGKLDVVGDDPAAKTDARVVEVEIRLDDSSAAEKLTNLQVEIELES